jgi:peroxiredoxin/CRP-like cAMP-binding protein
MPSAATRAIFLALGLTLVPLACSREGSPPSAEPGEAAPPFELDRLGGGSVRLADLRGKVVVLDFWATWCPPCVLEVPELNAFYARHREQGVELLAISIDEIGRDEVRRWAEEQGVGYPILHGDVELAHAYRAFEFPYHVVVSREGRIVRRLEPGFHDRDELAQAVAPALAGGEGLRSRRRSRATMLPPGSAVKAEELERRFAAGQCIVERGSVDPTLYVVRTGEVRAEGGGEPRRMGPGDVFGELGALAGTPARERIVAETDTVVLALERPSLEGLCMGGGEFAVRFVHHLGQELARAQTAGAASLLCSRSDPDLPQLARALLKGRTTRDAPSPVQGILRDIAAAAGLPMRRAYQGLQLLLERRVLRLVDDQLSVVDPHVLETLASRKRV